MATYYEMLKVQPTASAAEIEAAIQVQHDRWRRLVNHHDPSVVNQANLSLATLETIWTTLTDSSTRAAYDAGVGLGNAISGLADADASRMADSQGSSTASRRPVPIGSSAASETRWICPKCQQPAKPGQATCLYCGSTISEACPICRTVNHVSRRYCTRCGVDNADAPRIARDISMLCQEMNRLSNEHDDTLAILRDAKKLHATWAYVGGAAIACMAVVTIGAWSATADGLSVGWALFASLTFSIICWTIIMGLKPDEGDKITVRDRLNIMAGLVWLAGAVPWLWTAAAAVLVRRPVAVGWNVCAALAFFSLALGSTLVKANKNKKREHLARAMSATSEQQRVQLRDLDVRLMSIDPDLRYVEAMPPESRLRVGLGSKNQNQA